MHPNFRTHKTPLWSSDSIAMHRAAAELDRQNIIKANAALYHDMLERIGQGIDAGEINLPGGMNEEVLGLVR